MANPLTLYIPIKQDPMTQAEAQAVYDGFVPGVKQGLDDAKIVHYARLALIPNHQSTGHSCGLRYHVVRRRDGSLSRRSSGITAPFLRHSARLPTWRSFRRIRR